MRVGAKLPPGKSSLCATHLHRRFKCVGESHFLFGLSNVTITCNFPKVTMHVQSGTFGKFFSIEAEMIGVASALNSIVIIPFGIATKAIRITTIPFCIAAKHS
jgi:hypothetical protein